MPGSPFLAPGLLLWAKQTNAKGGVYVGAYKKRISGRVVSYDNEGNTATVATLTNAFITQDKVNVLPSDFGSVLTSVAAPSARVVPGFEGPPSVHSPERGE